MVKSARVNPKLGVRELRRGLSLSVSKHRVNFMAHYNTSRLSTLVFHCTPASATTSTRPCCFSCLHRRCTHRVESVNTRSADTDSFASFKRRLKCELFVSVTQFMTVHRHHSAEIPVLLRYINLFDFEMQT